MMASDEPRPPAAASTPAAATDGTPAAAPPAIPSEQLMRGQRSITIVTYQLQATRQGKLILTK